MQNRWRQHWFWNRILTAYRISGGVIGVTHWNNEGDLKKYRDLGVLRAIDNNKFDDNNINWKILEYFNFQNAL
jgi:hypothetical protein